QPCSRLAHRARVSRRHWRRRWNASPRRSTRNKSFVWGRATDHWSGNGDVYAPGAPPPSGFVTRRRTAPG
ncbi:MAG: hypothetical protein M3Q75_03385, partial [Gemmatimonadota bacterium]|nr:hypothetical protein [Gemmatimonadota bacterium]